MKKTTAWLLISIFCVHFSLAQKATITEKKMVMKTYMFSDPNPVPEMDKNYPYFRFDGYTNTSTQQEWNMVILENDYIKVYVNTDVGGKIWGAIEKSTGGEFLYYNDVVKFRDVAIRGPWTSGGLEFNFGLMSHTATVATPQDYVIKENTDGSVSCVIGAIDLHTGTKWNMEINLQKDKAYVETKSSFFNTNQLPVSAYHFSNAAAKSAGNLEFIFPGNHYIGHDGLAGNWPVENNRNIAFYDNNNFGGYKSYHVLNGYASFMGGYWHNDNFGFGNIRDYGTMPGKKLWIWGLSEEGMIWEDLLTDTKGQYIEFQDGNTFNQAMHRSELTPFKHREFIPYDSELSNELWFPLKNTGGMVAATEHGVLNTVRKDNKVEVRLSALAPIDSDLVIKTEGKVVSTRKVNLKPLELLSFEIPLDSKQDYTVELGNDLLFYSSAKDAVNVDRPLEANKDFNWDSAIGYFTKGFEIEKQQTYIEGGFPYKKAHDLYLKSIALDPAFAPALNRLGFSHFRRMQYEKALEYTNRSLSINTYDAEANYLFGLINAKLGKLTNAKSGFSIARESTSYRSAGYTEMAKLHLKQGRHRKAIEAANNALMYNTTNIIALEIQAVAYRLQKNTNAANKVLGNLDNLDNTSAFVVNEKIINGQAKIGDLAKLITNELAVQSYLTLALKYNNFGQKETGINVLKQSPKQAIVLLTLAYWNEDSRADYLAQGLAAPLNQVFPYRTATYEALIELMKNNDDWRLKYYASLILWKKGLFEASKELVKQCGDAPSYAPFYLSKAKLFADNTLIVKTSLAKAKKLAPKDWRVNLALINQYMADKEYALAAKNAKKTYAKYPEHAELGMNYAHALLQMGEYEKSLEFLAKFELLPFEGANKGRKIHHETAVRVAYSALKKEDYQSAIKYAEQAKLWPKNLGAGAPYNDDVRLENSIIAYSYKKMGNSKKSKEYQLRVIDYHLKEGQKQGVMLYLQVRALKNNDKPNEAQKLINSSLKLNPENDQISWVKAMNEEGSAAAELTKKLKEKAKKNSLDNSFLLLNYFLDIITN